LQTQFTPNPLIGRRNHTIQHRGLFRNGLTNSFNIGLVGKLVCADHFTFLLLLGFKQFSLVGPTDRNLQPDLDERRRGLPAPDATPLGQTFEWVVGFGMDADAVDFHRVTTADRLAAAGAV
jgi:hypothetical protein